MLVALPTHTGDLPDLARLLRWIARLGECKQHDALIVADAGTAFDQVINVREQAGQIFRSARVITNERPVSGWPDGANSLFKRAATYIHEHVHQSFLWLEPDCVVMRPGWLDELERWWTGSPGDFVGHIYECSQPFQPGRLMSGVAIYPGRAAEMLTMLPQSPRAWDVDNADMMVGAGRHTPLIYHFWGQQNLPPTFVAQKTQHSPINAMTLDDIPREAVIFHRAKGASLINLLERKLFPHEFKEKLKICFPVHAGDIGLAIQHANWMRVLNRRWEHEAIICHDPSAPVILLNQFEQLLRHSFTTVSSLVYPRPGIPTYPHAANWMFQSIALQMAKQKSPWFLLEADAVVLKRDWLEQLQNEYDRAGMPWMGSVVPHLGHMNGCGLYPANAAERMPRAMRATEQAWDMLAKDEIIGETHDASRLMFHTWTILDGRFCPVGGGQIPANITLDLARTIPQSAVFMHRVKCNSLLSLLVSGTYRHG